MAPDDQQLTLAAADLSRAAGPHWDSFMKALSARQAALAMKCVRATPETLTRVQGMAQEATVFYDMLAECRDNADKIRAGLKAQNKT